jgi:nucleotide-binding universal stress UspA family protein
MDVRDRADSNRAPIIVGLDGSSETQRVLHEGVVLAEALALRLVAMSIWQRSGPVYEVARASGMSPKLVALESTGDAADREFGKVWPQWFSTRIQEGSPAEALVDASETASYLVLGCNSHGSHSSPFLGSVSLYCASQAHCSVVISRRFV